MAHDHDREAEHAHDHGAHGRGSHDHGHSHAVDESQLKSRAFAIGIVLNLAFVAVEAVYGVLAHSMALLADAGHNLGDVLGLALSWGALILARRTPTARRTYGFRGATILASLANALVLLFVTGGIAWESVRRFFEPEPVHGKSMIVLALVGVAVNGVSAMLFLRDRSRDVNVRSAFTHLASDAVLALGVAVAGVAVLLTDRQWIDPLVSLALSISIVWATWSLFRRSVDLVLAAVPADIDPEEVRAYLTGLPGVKDVHDLHIWAVSTTETALTVHLVVPWTDCPPAFLATVSHALEERFRIGHATVQLEAEGGERLSQPCDAEVAT